MEAVNDLPLYQALNTAAFLIFLIALYLLVRSVSRLGHQKEGRAMKSSQKRFVALEKDYRWRRVKVAYFALTPLVLFVVTGVTYGTDGRGILQSQYDYQLERASDRFNTIFCLLITLLLLWAFYRYFLPQVYHLLSRLIRYMRSTP